MLDVVAGMRVAYRRWGASGLVIDPFSVRRFSRPRLGSDSAFEKFFAAYCRLTIESINLLRLEYREFIDG